ncbi:hypothetical protein Zm00014a_044598 [Zea mays]|uniref:Uncharacterized protein n=1 Tax=Zea mays TaxID=4577 RepID=A0A3L6G089_MAIZE|nr:hypothetical protein Zm00014a_044598 [Zea mays]
MMMMTIFTQAKGPLAELVRWSEPLGLEFESQWERISG